ncbi:MAG: hypothetical protein AMJ45_03650 [Syntrophobacter sp. DG_60]|nr:MAG: hypothetical protein AMJ45_03650 [Syntrophobacter sp. DG_60]
MKGKYIAVFLILIFLASYVIIFGKNGYLDLCKLKRQKDTIFQKNQEIQKENNMLRHQIERIESDSIYLEAIIREKTSLVKEGEIVIVLDD